MKRVTKLNRAYSIHSLHVYTIIKRFKTTLRNILQLNFINDRLPTLLQKTLNDKVLIMIFLLHKMDITHSILEMNSLYHGPECKLGLLNEPDVAAAVRYVRFWAAPQMCFSLRVQCS